jgi:hypothetical protein
VYACGSEYTASTVLAVPWGGTGELEAGRICSFDAAAASKPLEPLKPLALLPVARVGEKYFFNFFYFWIFFP